MISNKYKSNKKSIRGLAIRGAKSRKLKEALYPADYDSFIDLLDNNGWAICNEFKKANSIIYELDAYDEHNETISYDDLKALLYDYFSGNVVFGKVNSTYAPEIKHAAIKVPADIFDYSEDQLEFDFDESVKKVRESKSGKRLSDRYKDPEMASALFGRLVSDCDYILGACQTSTALFPNTDPKGALRHLWAGNIDDQIADMKDLKSVLDAYNIPTKTSYEDIDRYEKELKAL